MNNEANRDAIAEMRYAAAEIELSLPTVRGLLAQAQRHVDSHVDYHATHWGTYPLAVRRRDLLAREVAHLETTLAGYAEALGGL